MIEADKAEASLEGLFMIMRSLQKDDLERFCTEAAISTLQILDKEEESIKIMIETKKQRDKREKSEKPTRLARAKDYAKKKSQPMLIEGTHFAHLDCVGQEGGKASVEVFTQVAQEQE